MDSISCASSRPLATFDAFIAGETLEELGGRVLRFVMAEGVTATLSDEQLEQGERAGQRAVCGFGLKDSIVLARIQSTRDTITAALRYRAALAKTAAVVPPPVVTLPTTELEQDFAAAKQLTNEETVMELLKELLARVHRPPEPDGGVKAKLQPRLPRLPSGAVGLTPGMA